MKTNKVLIEKCNNFKIYYDKDNEMFVADKDKLDIHFEARSLWEIKGRIKETQTQEINKILYIKSGYANSTGIAKINLLTINKLTKRCKYHVLNDTNNSYHCLVQRYDYR